MKIRGQNISMFRGDSESITLRVRDKTGKSRKLQAGDTVRLTIRAEDCCGRVMLKKDITEFQDGAAVIDIAPEDTEHMRFGDYMYSVRWISADGTRITIIEPHTFTILPEGDDDEKRSDCCHRIQPC